MNERERKEERKKAIILLILSPLNEVRKLIADSEAQFTCNPKTCYFSPICSTHIIAASLESTTVTPDLPRSKHNGNSGTSPPTIARYNRPTRRQSLYFCFNALKEDFLPFPPSAQIFLFITKQTNKQTKNKQTQSSRGDSFGNRTIFTLFHSFIYFSLGKKQQHINFFLGN